MELIWIHCDTFFRICVHFLLLEFKSFILQVLLSSAPEIVHHSAHNHLHSHGHHHEIDMSHPILALNTVIVSIAVKEG